MNFINIAYKLKTQLLHCFQNLNSCLKFLEKLGREITIVQKNILKNNNTPLKWWVWCKWFARYRIALFFKLQCKMAALEAAEGNFGAKLYSINCANPTSVVPDQFPDVFSRFTVDVICWFYQPQVTCRTQRSPSATRSPSVS